MIRKAQIKDIKSIQVLINSFAKKDLMLARSLSELYENIRDFYVYEANGKVAGCCAIHISWEDLAEIKSLAVNQRYQRRGIGKTLVEACINDARELGAKKVFALTYSRQFFKMSGFKIIPHKNLPHKIWAECIRCSKFPDCKEIAMLKKI